MHNSECNYACMYVYAATSLLGNVCIMATTKGEPGDGFRFTKDLFLKVHHHASECFIHTVCIKLHVSCYVVHGDCCSPLTSSCRCLHYYHYFLGGTVDCHSDCIRSCYSCVILAELQAETEGYARPQDDIKMTSSTCR